MTTLGQLVSKIDERTFVGRSRELAFFRRWLAGDPPKPSLLNVVGPGGSGKSSLLRAFEREALRAGRELVRLDGRGSPATRRWLLGSLSASDLDTAIAFLNQKQPLVLVDTFEELGDLADFILEQLIPRLETTARVVIAGRYPLRPRTDSGPSWADLIQRLELGPLAPAEARDYLRRRGLEDGILVEQVVQLTGGHPLALSLAADMALEVGIRDFARAPEWRLAVRSLVGDLLEDVHDEGLRSLLEASALLRQFDEASLAAVAGTNDLGHSFELLCRFTIVRPAEHGLTLHDDVRRLLRDDLRWRKPELYEQLRGRAAEFLRQRSLTAGPDEREWLVTERLALSENPIVREVFFAADRGDVWVERGGPEDRDDVLRIERDHHQPALWPDFGRTEYDAWVEDLLQHPDLILYIARDGEGNAVGFSRIIPLTTSTAALIAKHPANGPIVERYLPEAAAEDALVYFFIGFAVGDALLEAARAALWRAYFNVVRLNGLYLGTLEVPDDPQGAAAARAFIDALGGHMVPGTDVPLPSGRTQGYALDLRRIGAEAWAEALMSGRPLPPDLSTDQIEVELKAVLQHWRDDRFLAKSPLAALDGGHADPEALRDRIASSLAAAGAWYRKFPCLSSHRARIYRSTR